jgi:hypothetical protein
MEIQHRINIILHVTGGVLSLAAGFAAVSVSKRSRYHRLFGRYFMWAMLLVILTALSGVIVFRRNSFLLLITLLSGYTCFSGFRVIRLKGQRPKWADCCVAVLVMAAALYYLYYLRQTALYWAPVITYSTIGVICFIALYDLARLFLPLGFLKRAVFYEHVYKMISALSGLVSAFCGTVLPQYKPYSQFLPSVIGLLSIIVIFIGFGKKNSLCAQL